MKIIEDSVLLKIFLNKNDRYKGRILYEQIVLKAKELELSGATVIHGILGFGRNKRIKSLKILTLYDKLPVIVEIIDTQKNIDKLMPFIDVAVTEGLVSLIEIKIFKCHRG